MPCLALESGTQTQQLVPLVFHSTREYVVIAYTLAFFVAYMYGSLAIPGKLFIL